MPGLEDEWPDIQGNILRPYAHPHARYAIARIDEAAGARRYVRQPHQFSTLPRRRTPEAGLSSATTVFQCASS